MAAILRLWVVTTGVGDLAANVLQMLAAGIGLASFIAISGGMLHVVNGLESSIFHGWACAALHSDCGITASNGQPLSLRRLWWQGFLTSASNPKAVIFFSALFPQFVDLAQPFWPQFLLLSATYVAVDGCFLSAYGMGASWFAKQLTRKARVWLDRVAGGLMIGAAVLLGMKTVTTR